MLLAQSWPYCFLEVNTIHCPPSVYLPVDGTMNKFQCWVVLCFYQVIILINFVHILQSTLSAIGGMAVECITEKYS